TRAPACSTETLEVERTARQREELNGLYVAMTRARSQIVVSAIEPHSAPASKTWWQRLSPHAQPVEPAEAATPLAGAQADAFDLLRLPRLAVRAARVPDSARVKDSDESRIGQAMHR